MTKWAIYHASREFAREAGDPILGTIEADTKAQAEELAAKDGEIASRAVAGAGLWAVRARDQEGPTR